jgi:hypothetical protein
MTHESDHVRTTYAQTMRGYDPDFEHALVKKILTTVAQASMVTEANAMAITTGETINALTTALALAIVMSPCATASPTALRGMTEHIGKRLRRLVTSARDDSDVQDFLHRCFRDVEGQDD